jgi:hypothetical protein
MHFAQLATSLKYTRMWANFNTYLRPLASLKTAMTLPYVNFGVVNIYTLFDAKLPKHTNLGHFFGVGW